MDSYDDNVHIRSETSFPVHIPFARSQSSIDKLRQRADQERKKAFRDVIQEPIKTMVNNPNMLATQFFQQRGINLSTLLFGNNSFNELETVERQYQRIPMEDRINVRWTEGRKLDDIIEKYNNLPNLKAARITAENRLFQSDFEIRWRKVLQPVFFNSNKSKLRIKKMLLRIHMYYSVVRFVPFLVRKKPVSWLAVNTLDETMFDYDENYPFDILERFENCMICQFQSKTTHRQYVEIVPLTDETKRDFTIECLVLDENGFKINEDGSILCHMSPIIRHEQQLETMKTARANGFCEAAQTVSVLSVKTPAEIGQLNSDPTSNARFTSFAAMTPLPGSEAIKAQQSQKKQEEIQSNLEIQRALMDHANNVQKVKQDVRQRKAQTSGKLYRQNMEQNNQYLVDYLKEQKLFGDLLPDPMGSPEVLGMARLEALERPKMMFSLEEYERQIKAAAFECHGLNSKMVDQTDSNYRKIAIDSQSQAKRFVVGMHRRLNEIFAHIYEQCYNSFEFDVYMGLKIYEEEKLKTAVERFFGRSVYNSNDILDIAQQHTQESNMRKILFERNRNTIIEIEFDEKMQKSTEEHIKLLNSVSDLYDSGLLDRYVAVAVLLGIYESENMLPDEIKDNIAEYIEKSSNMTRDTNVSNNQTKPEQENTKKRRRASDVTETSESESESENGPSGNRQEQEDNRTFRRRNTTQAQSRKRRKIRV